MGRKMATNDGPDAEHLSSWDVESNEGFVRLFSRDILRSNTRETGSCNNETRNMLRV